MIEKIKLDNFFSFGVSETIELNHNTNVLLGINGSGKSNFMKAIRFLYESVAGKGLEKIFLKDWGGFNNVANFSTSHSDFIRISYEFKKDTINSLMKDRGFFFKNNPIYEVTIHKTGMTSYFIEENLFCNNSKGEPPFVYLQMKNGKGKISAREEGKVRHQFYPRSDSDVFFKEEELVLRQISDPYKFFPLYTLKLAIESISVYDYFDTTIKSPIRMPAAYGTETRLMSTGENLVQILLQMKNKHTLQFDKIEEFLHMINPNFKDINFDVLGSNFFLALKEKNLAKTVSVEHISDGTLRFLLLLAILINPDRGYLVCIDEPEIGLHPDMIHMIAEAIKQASLNSQIIIATHSPLLLNSFELEDCLMFEKNTNNESIVCRKSEDDFPDWDDDFLVGQLWLSGKIGANRW